MDESFRNHEIANLLDLWEWCSRTLHVKWQRKVMLRNDCLLAMAFALSSDKSPFVSPITLPTTYKARPVPLFNKTALLRFWNVQPVTLLELCVGAFTKDSPLTERLNQIRLKWQDNPRLDEVAKKMRAREKRFRGDWECEGHPHDRHLELRAFAGDRRAFYQLKTELVEFTISTAVPEKIFLKAMELAQKEKVEEALTGQFQEPVGETAEDIVEMDRLLEDFFWKEINPLLSQPISPRLH